MGNEAEKLDTDVIEESGVIEEVEASTESTDEAETQKAEVEAWMQVDENAATEEGDDKPVRLSAKQKLRARLGDANDELEQLRQENADLKKGQTAEVAGSLKRPDRDDFETDAAYDDAYDTYRDQKDDVRISARGHQERMQQHVQAQSAKVDAHYERGIKLVEEHAISPEVYQASDLALRTAAETERPGHGEAIINDMISRLGEGSEKTLFFIGRNKPLLNEFRSLLKDDPSGLDALVFVVKQGEKANGTKKSTSRAPAPVAQINGETVTAPASRKAYDKAHKEGRGQDAFNIKSEAKKAGVDTKAWV
jgi:hypothetical protein